MKINAIKSQTNKSDKLELSGNILGINGKDFDLENLLSPSTEEDADNTQFYIDNPCYIDSQGVKHLKIYVSQEHFFLFVNNNYMLFYDKDLNGDIDMAELGALINAFNLPENIRRANHKKYRDSFTPEDWKKRMEACNPGR